ncbi:hypothetical protein VNI00_018901 [Paramarasmius palmivorus]|uniref:Uncharacterized protein n=1 Tax=Paramarasmius palmivorus TaxID=297713 RepID=A0AAW0AW47_9AGAR
MDAALKVINELSETEKAELVAEIEEEYQELLVEYNNGNAGAPTIEDDEQAVCRANLARVIQPFLHKIRQYTGLNVMLTVGRFKGVFNKEEKYDFLSLFSAPEGAPEWDKYRIEEYTDFGKKWCSWVRAVHTFEQNRDANAASSSSAPDTASGSSTSGLADVSGRGGAKSGSSKCRCAKADLESDSDEESDDEDDSDDSQESDQSDKVDESDESDNESPGPGAGASNTNQQLPFSARFQLRIPDNPTSVYDVQRVQNITANNALLAKLFESIPEQEWPSEPQKKSRKRKATNTKGKQPKVVRRSERIAKASNANNEQLDAVHPPV